jgi:acetolactate synthase regulatory subunit
MNLLTVELRVKNEDGALLRLLSMTRRRRFELVSLAADCCADGRILAVRMTVQAERSTQVLVRHIQKLVDVEHLAVVAATDPHADRPPLARDSGWDVAKLPPRTNAAPNNSIPLPRLPVDGLISPSS